MSIEVAGYRFDGEKQLTRYTLSIREKYEHNQRIELETGDGRFLSDLIRRHPNYPKTFISGVTAFKTGRYQSRNAHGFNRIDRSGYCVPFSYRYCIHGDEPTPAQKALTLAWRAVEHTLYTFENRPDKKCSACNELLTKALARHMPPRTFTSLWKEFQESCPHTVVTEKNKFSSRDILIDWQLTHKRNAMLERLCPRCYYQLSENKN